MLATFSHCLFMREAQLVLGFLMFLGRSLFPKFNKDRECFSKVFGRDTLDSHEDGLVGVGLYVVR